MANEVSYPGHKVRINFRGGFRSRFMNAKFTHTMDYNERNFLGSRPIRRSRKSEDLEFELQFENSSDLNSAGLLAGTAVESLDIVAKSDEVSLIPAALFASFPPALMEISEAGVEFDTDKDSTITVKVAVNVDDLAETAVLT